MLDPELKSLMQEMKQFLSEQSKMKSAVTQLEEQMRGLPQTFENKLKAIRSVAWDPIGRYRGVMGTEDDARCFGLYVMAHVGRDTRALDALNGEMKSILQRAMGGADDSAGGSLVPVEYSNRIQRLVEEYGVFPANAFRMPMPSDKLTFNRRTGGLTVYKPGANTAATESAPSFGVVHLDADEWCVLTLYPKALGEDAAAEVGELVAMEMALAFSQAADDAGFIGDATPDYLDITGITPKLIDINGVDDGGGLVLGTGNAYSELVEADFLKVKGRCPRYAQRNGKWYASNTFYWTVMAKIQLSKGGVTAAEFAGRRQLMFLGDPVEITQSLPSTEANSQVCCLYGDLRMSSTHGVRKDITIEQDSSVKFIERQVAVLGTQRNAINNHSLGSATEAGPIVGLITAAA